MTKFSDGGTAWILVGILLPLLESFGCYSPRSDGPPRYQLSGKATFAGKPIPFGTIMLEPDNSKGNRGPVGVADIRDGRYQIRGQRGHIGGPHIVIITGISDVVPKDPDEDTSLFAPYQIAVDLPARNSQYDFEVPADTPGIQ